MPGTVDVSPNGLGAKVEIGTPPIKAPEIPASPAISLGADIGKAADVNPEATLKNVANIDENVAKLPVVDGVTKAVQDYIKEDNTSKPLPESPFIARRGEPKSTTADTPTIKQESPQGSQTTPVNEGSHPLDPANWQNEGGLYNNSIPDAQQQKKADSPNPSNEATSPEPSNAEPVSSRPTETEYTQHLADASAAAQKDREMRGQNNVDPADPEGKTQQQRAQEASINETTIDSTKNPEDDKTKNQQELQSLEAKIADKSITPEEYEKYQKLREPDRRMQELDKKVKDGTATADELNEWKNGPEPEDVETRTLEQVEADLEKSLDETSLKIAEKFANGDFAGAEKDIVNFKKELAESQGLSVSDENVQNIRSFLEILTKPEKAGNPRETAKMRNVREKLQEVAKMEMQIRNLAETVKKMKDQEEKLKDGVNQSEADYLQEDNPDKKQQKLIVWSGKAMQLAGFQESIKVQKRLGRDLRIQQRQTAGYIHRKLGTKSFRQNVIFGVGTAIRQGGLAVANAYDAVFDFS